MDHCKKSILLSFVVATLLFVVSGCAPVDVDSTLREAAAAATEGKWQSAVELTKKCVKADRQNLSVKIFHGFCLFETRRVEDSLEILEEAATEAPDQFLPNFFFGWILCEQQQFGDALAPLQIAYDLRQQQPEIIPDLLILLSRCCLEQNLDEGINYLLELRNYHAFEQGPEVYNALGILYRSKADYEKARQSFLRAHEKDSTNAVVLQNLAVLNDCYLNKPKQAMRYYRASLAARQSADVSSGQAQIRTRLRQLARKRLQSSTN